MKFPSRADELELFLHRILLTIDKISTPTDNIEDESKIRDIDDRPILRAAVEGNADILITGDKDLLEADISNPRIVTSAEFLNM